MYPVIILYFLLYPLTLYAAGSTEIESILEKLLAYMTGAPARALAMLAIVGVGYATLFLGRMPKEKAISVVMGIAIIFGSASLMKTLGV